MLSLLKLNKKYSVLFSIILIFTLIQSSTSFILQVRKGYSRCFKAQPSPDKTLQTRFSFPRRQRDNCDVLFTINLVQQQNQNIKNIYNDMHHCHSITPGQPTVIKHTIQSHTLDSTYQICLDVLDDNNGGIFVQVFIGEKLNPILYGGSDQKLPLIQSQQLIDLDLKVQDIRRSLGWSRKLLEQGKQKGDFLQAKLIELDSFTISATIFQIVFLIVYGVIWVIFIKNQKNH